VGPARHPQQAGEWPGVLAGLVRNACLCAPGVFMSRGGHQQLGSAGGPAERGRVLQFPAGLHRQGGGRRLHQARAAPHLRQRPRRQGTRPEARGTDTTTNAAAVTWSHHLLCLLPAACPPPWRSIAGRPPCRFGVQWCTSAWLAHPTDPSFVCPVVKAVTEGQCRTRLMPCRSFFPLPFRSPCATAPGPFASTPTKRPDSLFTCSTYTVGPDWLVVSPPHPGSRGATWIRLGACCG